MGGRFLDKGGRCAPGSRETAFGIRDSAFGEGGGESEEASSGNRLKACSTARVILFLGF
jgi:hypothetical protein